MARRKKPKAAARDEVDGRLICVLLMADSSLWAKLLYDIPVLLPLLENAVYRPSTPHLGIVEHGGETREGP
jgi:hypothetical protein